MGVDPCSVERQGKGCEAHEDKVKEMEDKYALDWLADTVVVVRQSSSSRLILH